MWKKNYFYAGFHNVFNWYRESRSDYDCIRYRWRILLLVPRQNRRVDRSSSDDRTGYNSQHGRTHLVFDVETKQFNYVRVLPRCSFMGILRCCLANTNQWYGSGRYIVMLELRLLFFFLQQLTTMGGFALTALTLAEITQINNCDNILYFFSKPSKAWGLRYKHNRSCLLTIFILFFSFISAFYGVLFPTQQEPAFSNYRLWESLGFVISFAYGDYLCVNVKLYILIVVLCIGVFLYAIIEWIRRSETAHSEEIALNGPASK